MSDSVNKNLSSTLGLDAAEKAVPELVFRMAVEFSPATGHVGFSCNTRDAVIVLGMLERAKGLFNAQVLPRAEGEKSVVLAPPGLKIPVPSNGKGTA